MLVIRLLLSGLLAATGLVLTSQAPAQACSCVMAGTQAHLRRAEVVFTGTLVERIPPPERELMSSSDPATHVFDVDTVYLGRVGARADVLSAMSGASCGLENMEVGQEYVVYATGSKDEELWANLCGGTAPAGDRVVTALERYAGPGRSVGSGTDLPAASTLPVAGARDEVIGVEESGGAPAALWWGGGAALLAVVGGLLLRRRLRA